MFKTDSRHTHYVTSFVRVNPYYFDGEDYRRDEAGLDAHGIGGWSLEIAEPTEQHGMVIWRVAADFESLDDAFEAANGAPMLALEDGHPGDVLGWCLYRLETSRGWPFLDWVEWCGDAATTTAEQAMEWARKADPDTVPTIDAIVAD